MTDTTISIGIDSRPAEEGGRRVKRALDDVSTSARSATQAQRDMQTAMSMLDRDFASLRARVDPATEALRRFETEQKLVRQAMMAGTTTHAEGLRVMGLLQREYDLTSMALKRNTAAAVGYNNVMKLQGYQMANLSYQINDVVSGLAMGQSPMMILTQQGGQFVQIFGGVKNTLKTVLSFITPLRLGVAGLAGAIALIGARAVDVEGETRAMSVSLRAFGKDAELTTRQIHDLVESMRDLGVSKSDARTAAGVAIKVPGASGSAIEQALKAAPDFAAAYGTSVDDAAKALTQMGTDGYSAISKLDEAYRFLSKDQAALIRQLSEHGDKAGAVALAYQALETRINGAAINAMSPMGQATTELARNWQDLIDTIANTGPVTDAIASLSGGFKSLTGIFSGDLTAAWDGWVKHVTNDPIFSLLKAVGSGYLKFGSLVTGIEDNPAQSMGGPGQSHAAPYRGSSSSSIASSAIDAETAAYERQMAALRGSASERQILQARTDALTKAVLAGKNAQEIATEVDRAGSLATARLAASANDNYVAIKQQMEGTLALASAGGVSTQAGRQAQAEMQARAAKLQNVTVNVDKLTKALLKQSDAEAHLQAVEDLRSAKLDTDLSRRQAQAAQITDPTAQRDAQMAIDRQKELNELTVKYHGNIEDVNAAMQEFDRKAIYDSQTKFWNDVSKKAEQFSDDISQFLVDGFVNAEKGGRSAFENLWDGALAGAKRLVANIAAEFLRARIIMPIVTQIVGANSGLLGIVGAAGGGVAGGSGLSSIYNGASGMLNGGLYSNTMAGIGSWIATSQLGSSLGLSNAVSGGIRGGSFIGGGAGSGYVINGLGSSFSSALGNTPYGIIGSLGASALGFKGSGNMAVDTGFQLAGSIGGSMAAGALSGTAAGAMAGAWAGPIGAAVGALIGTVASGFFSRKPSNKGASRTIGFAGDTSTLGEIAYNPSEKSQQNIDALAGFSDSLVAIEKQLIDITGGTINGAVNLAVGSRDGIYAGYGDTGPQSVANRVTFDRSEAGAKAALTYLIKSITNDITDQVSSEANDALHNILNTGNTDSILSGINTLSQYKSVIDALNTDPQSAAIKDQLEALTTQFDDLIDRSNKLGLSTGDLVTERDREIKAITDQTSAGQAIAQIMAANDGAVTTSIRLINEQFAALIKQSDQLGLATSLLVTERDKEIQAVKDQAAAPFYTQAIQSGTAISSYLQSQSLSDVSSLSPSAKYLESRNQYQTLLAQAQGGDQSVIPDLTSAANTFLGASQGRYASSAGFANDENSVRSALADLGTSLTDAGNIQQQINDSINAAGMDTVDAINAMKDELVKLRADLTREQQLNRQQQKAAAA